MRRVTSLMWLTLLLPGLVSSPSLPAQETPPANEGNDRYEVRDIHDPNGIGKFYMGREIAYVMGAQAIGWLERPEREREEQLRKLVKSLDLKPGMVVADVGAGSGVITMMMAPKVEPEGKVLALDIQQPMLDALAVKCKRARVDNVELILTTNRSVKLKPETVDLAIMVDVYHELEFPYEMLRELSAAIKPGGRIAFIEFRKEDPRVLIKEVHKMSEEQVKKEALLPEMNLKFLKNDDRLPQQHLLFFEKVRPGEKAAAPAPSTDPKP